jgi:deoxyribodipyrimidine photo-lyase
MTRSTPPARTLYWHRNDLRLSDNPALHFAVEQGAVQPVFILDDKAAENWAYGGASRWWLHQSLESLQESYKKIGVTLLLRRGDSEKIILDLVKELDVTHAVWNRRYEPHFIRQDTHIKTALTKQGCAVKSFNGHLLFEPWEIQNKSGQPFRVFTPFWRNLSENSIRIDPLTPAPKKIAAITHKSQSDHLTAWDLLPTRPNWAKSFEPHWQSGETVAQKKLHDFLNDTVSDYKDGRDFPAQNSTSFLSPHLVFGEISPRQIWYTTREAMNAHRKDYAISGNAEHFLREVAWREFAYHLLYHFPETPTKALYPKFNDFPWRSDKKDWQAWTKGQTGYPIVDAGMRQLWQTGYMHNRVRMIVASFLVKDLLLSWQDGAQWFWDTLVDADLANNTLGWQWTAGCGADAAPYFRVFNPTLQSAKFDKAGAYIRRFIPEIAALPDKYLHNPSSAPEQILKDAGVTLGKTYPKPIVDHSMARDRALKAFKELSV